MSLVGTLAKVAVGLVVAKGLGSVVSGAGGAQPRPGSAPRPGGSPPPGRTTRAGPSPGPAGDGGLMDVLGQMLGTSGPRGRGSLGSAMDELSRLSRPGGASARPETASPRGSESGSLGDLLDQSLRRYGEPPSRPTRAQEDLAGVLLRALIQAAKADGRVDQSERDKLMRNLGQLDRSEIDFVNRELGRPIDIAGLARDVPRGSEAQVYMMSVAAIDLDTRQEARYLQELAEALGLDAATANAVHDRLGAPRIFR